MMLMVLKKLSMAKPLGAVSNKQDSGMLRMTGNGIHG